MARMLPYPVAEFKTPGEEKLYYLFQRELPSNYTVLYGRRWKNAKSGNPDPECDFIITRPDGAILVLEAKGGRWERVDGEWRCYGEPVLEKDDPFHQAIQNKADLLKLLKQDHRWEGTFFPLDYAIALPDTSFRGQNTVGLPDILTFEDINTISIWVEHAMQASLTRMYPAKATPVMIEYLIQILMRDYVVRLNEILEIDDQNLFVFTEQQLNFDRQLVMKKRLTVQGCAGSGKTLLAIRQVKRLSQKSNVKSIFFTCFNRELGDWLDKNTKKINGCVTKPIVDYMNDYCIEVGVLTGKETKNEEFYDRLPYDFLQALEIRPIKFDAIVVDEGQSFKPDWWAILESLLKDPASSYFYIFFDDFQRIYQETINHVPGEDDPFELSYNLRNTASIHRQAIKFLPLARLPECNNVQGEPVDVYLYDSERSMRELLRKILHQLVGKGGVSSKDVIVLTPKRTESVLPNMGTVGPYQLVSIEKDEPAAIRYATIQSFRGMERQVVIMTEFDSKVTDLESLNYLGSSRAKTKLIMLLSNDLDPEISKKMIEGTILEQFA